MEYGKIWFGEESESELEENNTAELNAEKYEERVEYRKYRTLDGDTVRVIISEDEITIAYSNGTFETISVEDLRICPKCLQEGLLPFTSSEVCPIHKDATIPYDPDGFHAIESAYKK